MLKNLHKNILSIIYLGISICKMTSSNQAVMIYDESMVPPHYLNVREIPIGNMTVKIFQNWQSVGIAAVLWDAVLYIITL